MSRYEDNDTEKYFKFLAQLTEFPIREHDKSWKSPFARYLGINEATFRGWCADDHIPGGAFDQIAECKPVKEKGIKKEDWYGSKALRIFAGTATERLTAEGERKAAERLRRAIEMRGISEERFFPEYCGLIRQTPQHHLSQGKIPWKSLPKIINGLNKRGTEIGFAPITWEEIVNGRDEKKPSQNTKEFYGNLNEICRLVAELLKENSELRGKMKQMENRLLTLAMMIAQHKRPNGTEERRHLWNHVDVKKITTYVLRG